MPDAMLDSGDIEIALRYLIFFLDLLCPSGFPILSPPLDLFLASWSSPDHLFHIFLLITAPTPLNSLVISSSWHSYPKNFQPRLAPHCDFFFVLLGLLEKNKTKQCSPSDLTTLNRVVRSTSTDSPLVSPPTCHTYC